MCIMYVYVYTHAYVHAMCVNIICMYMCTFIYVWYRELQM